MGVEGWASWASDDRTEHPQLVEEGGGILRQPEINVELTPDGAGCWLPRRSGDGSWSPSLLDGIRAAFQMFSEELGLYSLKACGSGFWLVSRRAAGAFLAAGSHGEQLLPLPLPQFS